MLLRGARFRWAPTAWLLAAGRVVYCHAGRPKAYCHPHSPARPSRPRPLALFFRSRSRTPGTARHDRHHRTDAARVAHVRRQRQPHCATLSGVPTRRRRRREPVVLAATDGTNTVQQTFTITVTIDGTRSARPTRTRRRRAPAPTAAANGCSRTIRTQRRSAHRDLATSGAWHVALSERGFITPHRASTARCSPTARATAAQSARSRSSR
jgi:hypothetical protein